MSPENRSIPNWARRERQKDMEWIKENLHVFQPAAQIAFEQQGRGAIVVDTTSRPTGEGHPFAYFNQELVEKEDDEDIKRMVREYNPKAEFIVVLLKTKKKTSAYRIKPLPRDL